MKKIMTISLCLIFLGVSIAVASPGLTQQTTIVPLYLNGTFEGNIGPRPPNQNGSIIGTMNGTYQMRNRGGRFLGEWQTENRTGSMRGVFGRHLLFGRVSTMVNGTLRTLPIVGFLRANNNSFVGRFMAPRGPALYFWGTYT